jgi:transposase
MNAVVDTTSTGEKAPGRRRNRSWPEALKREIVAASFAPGASVSVVARRYDVNTNRVFSWRRLYRDGAPPSSEPSGAVLVPVTVTPDPGGDAPPAPRVADTIEIELAGGYRVRVAGGFDEQALRCVLDVLEGRPASRSHGDGR